MLSNQHLYFELKRRGFDVDTIQRCQDQMRRAKAKNELQRRVEARNHLLPFVQYMNDSYFANWHHVLLCAEIERWVRKEVLRIGIFLPPQHGKSEIGSRNTPAFIFGQNPDVSVISCSYGASLAKSMNRDVQRIMDNPRYAVLFPRSRLFDRQVRTTGNWLRNADEFEIAGRKGYYRCAGVGGGITGRPMEYGIIDDPVKDRAAAHSACEREKILGWYRTVFRARRKGEDTAMMIIQTRWHEYDLSGCVEKQAQESPDADQWYFLVIPAICDEPGVHSYDPRKQGEALWPLKNGKRHFDEKSLRATKIAVGSFDWQAVYQQKPTSKEGVIFKAETFRPYRVEINASGLTIVIDPTEPTGKQRRFNPETDLTWFQIGDTAMKEGEENAYTVIITFALAATGELFVFDVYRSRLIVPYQYLAIKQLRIGSMPNYSDEYTFAAWMELSPRKWPAPMLYMGIEEAQSGIGLISRSELDGCPITPLRPDGDKIRRAGSISALYQAGMVYHRSGAEWLPLFEEELTKFPSGQFADQVDCMSYAGMEVNRNQLLRLAARIDGSLVYQDDRRAAGLPIETTSVVNILGHDFSFEND